MKKYISILIFSFIIYFTIKYSTDIIYSISFSFNICFKNLFPSIIPFLFLSNIIIDSNIILDINDILGVITNKIFHLNKNFSYIIIMSIISGSPSNAKYINDSYNKKNITNDEINKCLKFCHYTNPLFVINVVGKQLLNNKVIGYVLFISQLLSSLTLAIFSKKEHIKNNNINYKSNNNNFMEIINNSIISTTNTLLLILGVITISLVLTTSIDNTLNINNNYKFIYGLFEITQGLKYLSLSNLNINIKTIIASFIISFGGFCIHIQVFSILNNKKIKYTPYFLYRILQAILSSIYTYIILLLTHFV